jgi:hypothetical protein
MEQIYFSLFARKLPLFYLEANILDQEEDILKC